MITFRYHVVSLVAVFLALGIGVIAGTSFFSQATVRALKNAQDRLATRNEALRTQVETLQEANGRLGEFAALSRQLLTRDSLRDRPVVVVSFDTTPEAAVTQVIEALSQAGARVDGSIQLSVKLDLANESRRQAAALALEMPTADAEQLRPLLVERIAAMLSGKAGGVLQRFADAGLARVLDAPGGRRPGSPLAAGTAVVLLAPGPDRRESPGFDQQVIVPVLRAVAESGVLAAAGEAGTSPLPLVGRLREDPGLRVVTVDGVDGPVGQTALVLGLSAASGGTYGHYGTGGGASALLPEPSPAPR